MSRADLVLEIGLVNYLQTCACGARIDYFVAGLFWVRAVKRKPKTPPQKKNRKGPRSGPGPEENEPFTDPGS
jgi:hypothetical protein